METPETEDYLMLSGIQHFAFCKRQWALIHLEQHWQENILTFGGRELHSKTDDPFVTEKRGTVLVARSLPIVSHRIKLYGVADVVEFHRDESGVSINGRKGFWRPFPVEYKYGEPKKGDWDIVQLCAQAICLEEMFKSIITEGAMFYGRVRRRQGVIFDERLRQRVKDLSENMHRLFKEKVTPLARKTKACYSCSLVEICLPNLSEKRSVSRYLADTLRNID